MSSLDPAAPTAGSTPPRLLRRERVFCHECHRDWYRDVHGLVCPNESCRSDFVEIIENSNDLREALDDYDDFDEHHHMHGRPHTFPPFAPSPGGTTIFRAEGPGFSYVSTRTISPPRGVRTPIAPEDEMIADLFSTMIRNIVGDQHMQTRNREGGPDGTSARGQAGAGGSPQPAERPQANPFSMFGGGPRLNPRDADSPQAGEAPQVLDVATFLASLFPPGGGDDHLPPGLFARILGIPPGAGGDYVYSQAELDRIVSQLMDQHQGNAPPPANKDEIEALPRIKVTRAMANDGVDCAVCKDDLVVDEEVCRLPCKHTYHFECVSRWLESHDTCPICRNPITPEDKRPQQSPQQSQQSQQRASPSGGIASGVPFFNLFSSVPPQASGQPAASHTPTDSQSNDRHAEAEQPVSSGNSTTDSETTADSGSGGARSAFASLFRRR